MSRSTVGVNASLDANIRRIERNPQQSTGGIFGWLHNLLRTHALSILELKGMAMTSDGTLERPESCTVLPNEDERDWGRGCRLRCRVCRPRQREANVRSQPLTVSCFFPASSLQLLLTIDVPSPPSPLRRPLAILYDRSTPTNSLLLFSSSRACHLFFPYCRSSSVSPAGLLLFSSPVTSLSSPLVSQHVFLSITCTSFIRTTLHWCSLLPTPFVIP